MKKTHDAVAGNGSALKRYQDVVVGSSSILYLLFFEFCLFLSIIPGALGLLLRKTLWPRLFSSCGKGVNFGTNITLRHPGRIELGNNVVISEGCVLDGRSEGDTSSIIFGNDVILSNNVVISCKNGRIKIGAQTGINTNTIIQSTNDCPVTIGEDVIVGQMCFVVGGGSYNTENIDIPMRTQGIKKDSGVNIGDDVWLGANVSVLGGVNIANGSIAAAGSVVTKDVPEYSVCRGVPAQVVKRRTDTS